MTKDEIIDHLFKEKAAIRARFDAKVIRAKEKCKRRKVYMLTATMRTKNNTEFTAYFEDVRNGGTLGVWYNTGSGYVFAVVGQALVTFVHQHFFERFAERFLKQEMDFKLAAKKFFTRNKAIGYFSHLLTSPSDDELTTNIIYDGGIGMCTSYKIKAMTLHTYVSNDMLFDDQIYISVLARTIYIEHRVAPIMHINLEGDVEIRYTARGSEWVEYYPKEPPDDLHEIWQALAPKS